MRVKALLLRWGKLPQHNQRHRFPLPPARCFSPGGFAPQNKKLWAGFGNPAPAG